MKSKTIYHLQVPDAQGQQVSLSDYHNRPMLLVNIATGCGLANQLQSLDQLQRQYTEVGLAVLAFPSNDFAGQEPLTAVEVAEHCNLHFGPSYRVMGKIQVRGPRAHPLYRWLADPRATGRWAVPPLWNYHKYLIGTNGQLVDYFLPTTSPMAQRVRHRIEQVLSHRSYQL